MREGLLDTLAERVNDTGRNAPALIGSAPPAYGWATTLSDACILQENVCLCQPDTIMVAANAYRYGFNGKEDDTEWGDQVIQDYGFRIYSPALGKFLSVDPLTREYPWYTPYQFAGNTPIQAADLDGLEPDYRYRTKTHLYQDWGGGLITRDKIELKAITGEEIVPHRSSTDYEALAGGTSRKRGDIVQGVTERVPATVPYVELDPVNPYAPDFSELSKGLDELRSNPASVVPETIFWGMAAIASGVTTLAAFRAGGAVNNIRTAFGALSTYNNIGSAFNSATRDVSDPKSQTLGPLSSIGSIVQSINGDKALGAAVDLGIGLVGSAGSTTIKNTAEAVSAASDAVGNVQSGSNMIQELKNTSKTK